jgi:hypothetical protein
LYALRLLLAVSSPAVELHWDAPPGCPAASDVEARLAEYTGGVEPEQPLRVDARVEAEPDGQRWHLRLAITRGDQQEVRELHDAACEGLAESAAVLVAIAIAPDRVADVPVPTQDGSVSPAIVEPPAPTADVRTEVDDAPAASDVVTPEPRAPPWAPMHVSMRASGGASIGWLPIGGDIGLALAVYWRRLRLELAGAYGHRRRVRFDDLPSSGADVSGWAVGARACYVFHPTRWLDLPCCAGLEAGQVIGRPVQLIEGRLGRPTWAAGVLAPALRFVVHPRVALWLSPEVQVSITRPTLRVAAEREPLFVAAGAGARLHAGIELRFR